MGSSISSSKKKDTKDAKIDELEDKLKQKTSVATAIQQKVTEQAQQIENLLKALNIQTTAATKSQSQPAPKSELSELVSEKENVDESGLQKNVPPELKYPNTNQRVELGDHVYAKFNAVCAHHGIVSEKKLIDNKWCYKVISLYQSGIVEQELSEFLSDKSKGKFARKSDLQVCNYSEPTRSSKQVVVDAKYYLNTKAKENDYHLLAFNCESFALECKLGPREDCQPHSSTQINKGRHVILVAGIVLVSTVFVLSLPAIAIVPTMGIAALHTIGIAPWYYIVPVSIGWCFTAGSFILKYTVTFLRRHKKRFNADKIKVF